MKTTRKAKMTIAAVALMLLVVGLISVPYLITTWGPYSVCLEEGGLTDKHDKISGAQRYLAQRQQSGTYPRSKTLTPTGEVDKGKGDDPKLGWMAYIIGGQSHYVHFVERDNKTGNVERDVLVIVDGCGEGKYRGTH